jgi:hypothetical protein
MATLINKNIKTLQINRRENSLSDEVSIVLDTLSGTYSVGQEVSYQIAGQTRTGYVVGISERMGTDGQFERVLNILSLNTLLTLKSPKKTQKFITVSEQELYEFNRDYPHGADYLDFAFRMKKGDDYGVGGWRCHEIIRFLAKKMGLSDAIVGTPDYWVKEFSVDPGTPYFSAILSLVQVFSPIVFVIDSVLFIADGGSHQKNLMPTQTQYVPQDIVSVSQEIVRHDKVSQFRVEGQLGAFNPDKVKEYITRDPYGPYTVVLPRMNGYIAVTVHCYGIHEEYYENDIGDQPFSLGIGDVIDPITGVVTNKGREKVRVGWAKDIYGRPGHLLYESRAIIRGRYLPGFFMPVIITESQRLTINYYENDHYRFSNPRPAVLSSEVHEDMYGFYVQGGVLYYGPIADAAVSYNYTFYDDRGNVVLTARKEMAKCLVENVTGVRDKITPLKELASEYKEEIDDWLNGNAVSMNGTIRSVMTRHELINNVRLTPYTYARKVDVQGLTTVEDESFYTKSGSVDVLEGHLPASPVKYRLGPVYEEYNGTTNPNKDLTKARQDNDITLDTPGIVVQVPSSSQEDVSRIFDTLWYRYTKDELVRRYTLLDEVDLYPGMPVSLRDIVGLDPSEQLKVPTLDNNFVPYISDYTLTKDYRAGTVRTDITVKAKL